MSLSRASVFGLVVCLLLAGVAQAAVLPGDDAALFDPAFRSSSFNGGPFILRLFDDDAAGGGSGTYSIGTSSITASEREQADMLVFCVERGETFGFNRLYDITAFNTVSQNTNRRLTGYAAWVFEKFRGLAENIDPWLGREDDEENPTDGFSRISAPSPFSSGDLEKFQQAIWAGMVNVEGDGTLNQPGTSDKSEWTISDWSAYTNVAGVDIRLSTFYSSGWTTGTQQDMLKELKAYRVINLWHPNDPTIQDQIFIGLGDQSYVPEPASMLIWGCVGGVAAGLNWYRRRKAA